MTIPEIKSQLLSVSQAERTYRLARDKANAYGQLLMGGKAVRYDSDGSTHEKNGNSVENAYVMLAEYEAEADRLMNELVQERKSAEQLISTVNDNVHREILTRRYIIGQRWEDIADAMNYGVRHVHKLHGAALQNMALNGTLSM